MVSESPPNAKAVESTSRSREAAGNVTATPDGTFSIDAAGRVVGHTPGADPPITFAFDATGLRTKRTEGASTTLYLRDGGQVIGEWNGTSWTKEYVWLGNTLLATIEGSTIKYHHQDHLSIRATTFTDGMVGEEQGHYPFGEPWYETSPETTRIFTTYEREAGGSLDYAMFRWMGPEAGRFLAADPVHGSLGDGQSWNRYAYAGNDPVNRWDPWGLYFTEDPGPSDIGVGDGPPGGGAGGGGPSQCDPYDVSICRNTQTGEIVTCCCSGGRWVQCDFTLSEADHEPIDPVERHENWIRDTEEALGPLDENPYFGGGRGGGGGHSDSGGKSPWDWYLVDWYLAAPSWYGPRCQCWWTALACGGSFVRRAASSHNPESFLRLPPGSPPPWVNVTYGPMVSGGDPEARTNCTCLPPGTAPGCGVSGGGQ
jgi:RHS repeat-associated protein